MPPAAGIKIGRTDPCECLSRPASPPTTVSSMLVAGRRHSVDLLINDGGWSELTVLDVSKIALRTARERLGATADQVHWLATDLLTWRAERRYAVWHDRAVLHFFVSDEDRTG